jgi:DNA-binding transcriptional LysR family regulator
MAKLDLRRLDMTLLLTLSSLLRTRQVTATANELGLMQSSVSHALARLRDVFDDPLFVRRPFGMEPTPRALELEPIAQAILDLSQQALAPTEFDLADAEGIVRIAALDHHCALIAGPLIERLRHDAPRLKVSFRALARRPAVDAVLAGKIDVGLGLFWNLPDAIELTTLCADSSWTGPESRRNRLHRRTRCHNRLRPRACLTDDQLQPPRAGRPLPVPLPYPGT